MLYINKRRTPREIQEEVTKIIQTPDSGYGELILPRDSKRLRKLFDQLPKKVVQDFLIEEQHGLCAYCMRRIVSTETTSAELEDKIRIEHYEPLSQNKEKALDYQNFLGVCFGGEHDERELPFVKCCDAARTDRELVINPWDRRQMEAIAYEPSGRIYVSNNLGVDPQLVEEMQRDIDEELCLNGLRDKNGNMKHDTASNLVAHRRQIYDRICSQFERWSSPRRNCLNAQFLEERIRMLEKQLTGNGMADPYVGVWLYFYRKKYNKLKRIENRALRG